MSVFNVLLWDFSLKARTSLQEADVLVHYEALCAVTMIVKLLTYNHNLFSSLNAGVTLPNQKFFSCWIKKRTKEVVMVLFQETPAHMGALFLLFCRDVFMGVISRNAWWQRGAISPYLKRSLPTAIAVLLEQMPAATGIWRDAFIGHVSCLLCLWISDLNKIPYNDSN